MLERTCLAEMVHVCVVYVCVCVCWRECVLSHAYISSELRCFCHQLSTINLDLNLDHAATFHSPMEKTPTAKLRKRTYCNVEKGKLFAFSFAKHEKKKVLSEHVVLRVDELVRKD